MGTYKIDIKMEIDSDHGTQTVNGTRSEEQISGKYLWDNRNTGDGPIRQTSVQLNLSHK